MKYNDLIFRKRLMNSSWRFRKKVLSELKAFFAGGGDFDTSSLDKDIATLKRDYLLMFGSDEAISSQLDHESKYLPLNQRPSHHEQYAIITELAKLQLNGPTISPSLDQTPVGPVTLLISKSYDFLDRNTLKVTDSWLYWTIRNGNILGEGFVAPSATAAQKFFEEVELARAEEAKGIEITASLIGLRAMGFLPLDPLLNDPKVMEQEAELISYILETVDGRNLLPSSEGADYDEPSMTQILAESAKVV